MKIFRALGLVAPLLLTGCFSAIPYVAQPERIRDPQAEVVSLIAANAYLFGRCPTKPAFEGAVLTVRWVCTNEVGNAVARLDRVASVGVDKSGDRYRVVVKHSPGIEDFVWYSDSLEDIERLADAFTALSRPSLNRAPAKKTDPT